MIQRAADEVRENGYEVNAHFDFGFRISGTSSAPRADEATQCVAATESKMDMGLGETGGSRAEVVGGFVSVRRNPKSVKSFWRV